MSGPHDIADAPERAKTLATTYQGVHAALKRARGSAVGRRCAAPDCDTPAIGWGLVGRPSAIDALRGGLVRYSRVLEDFAPLCRSHNSLLDGGGDWTFCPGGHFRALAGIGANGRCLRCNADDARERRKTTRRPAGDHARTGTESEGISA